MQEVLGSARPLTDARHGVITIFDDAGRIQDVLASGVTPEESQRLWNLPEDNRFFEYLGKIDEPLRLGDCHSYTRALGLPEFRPPVPVSPISPLPGRAHPSPRRARRQLLSSG